MAREYPMFQEMRDTEVDSILVQREYARERKDWEESDRLRDKLLQGGVVVVDTKEGQRATGGSAYRHQRLESTVVGLKARIRYLEYTVVVLRKGEFGLHRKIQELVAENLALQYGDKDN